LEWSFKWLKLFLILGLSILMIVIAAGGSYIKSLFFTKGETSLTFDPQQPAVVMRTLPTVNTGPHIMEVSSHLDLVHTVIMAMAIPDPRSRVLGGHSLDSGSGHQLETHLSEMRANDSHRTSCTLAVFAFIGVEMVIVTAGEARYPRQDLPVASRWIYIFVIVVYTLLDLLASLNVRYDDPALLPYNAKSTISMSAGDKELFPHSTDGTVTTGERSPFIIAVIRAGFTRENSALPHFLNGCLYFAALTAA
jgi:amino acid permease